MDGVQGYSSHSDNESSGIKLPKMKTKECEASGDESPKRRDKLSSGKKKHSSCSPERSRKSDDRRSHDDRRKSDDKRKSDSRRSSSSRNHGVERRSSRHSRSRSRSRSRSPDRKRRRSRSRERRHRRSRSRSPRRRDHRRRSRSRSRSRTPPWSSQRGSRSGVTRAVLPSLKESQNGAGLKKRVLTTEEVEQKLAAHMVTMQKKASEEAKNANLPSYLNPAMVNARQFKQQQEKKKLLWSSKKSQDPAEASSSQWNAASMGSSTFEDQATADKYKRFMGIKGDGEPSSDRGKELLDNLEKEYEKSRVFQLSRGAGGTTGIGLGFGSMDKS